VKRISIGFLALLLLTMLAGCGGGSGNNGSGNIGNGISQVSGVVSDLSGNPVRGATVYTDANGHFATTSSTNGTFLLTGVPDGDLMIFATASQSGISYSGQNFAPTFDRERTKSVNITVAPTNSLARIHGVVRDLNGHTLGGAHVFANAGNLGSSVVITRNDGSYDLRGLIAGVAYTLTSNAGGYNSDVRQITLNSGQNAGVDFALNTATNTTLSAPGNLTAIAWTSPEFVTSQTKASSPYEAIKSMLDPKRKKFDDSKSKRYASRKGRGISGNANVEVDLEWDPVQSFALLGYGIYRGTQQSSTLTGIDVFRDPLGTFYSDLDDALQIGQTYVYEVTSLNTSYPDTNNSESAPSNLASATPIGPQDLGIVLSSPLGFQWAATSGASQYAVFVFSQFPAVGLNPVWTSPTSSSTQTVYSGPVLMSGHRYYYFVLGLGQGGNSKSISTIGSFIAP
jgi:hypothetical protein